MEVTLYRTPAEQALDLVQREYPNYHPLIALARMAHNPAVIADPKVELEVHRTILPYIQPKLSNVEVRVDTGDARRVVVSLFEDVEVKPGALVRAEVPLLTDVEDIVPLDAEA